MSVSSWSFAAIPRLSTLSVILVPGEIRKAIVRIPRPRPLEVPLNGGERVHILVLVVGLPNPEHVSRSSDGLHLVAALLPGLLLSEAHVVALDFGRRPAVPRVCAVREASVVADAVGVG